MGEDGSRVEDGKKKKRIVSKASKRKILYFSFLVLNDPCPIYSNSVRYVNVHGRGACERITHR